MKATWAYFEKALSDTACKELIEYIESKYEYTEAKIGFEDSNTLNEDYRKCDVAWVDARDSDVSELLWYYALRANRDYFNFDLQYINEIQFTRYDGDKIFPGKYDWHHDVNWGEVGTHHRKLSISIILNDEYEGGILEMDPTDCEALPKEANTKGTIILFPSFFRHQVTPVTSGTRYSLVTWVEGPKWR